MRRDGVIWALAVLIGLAPVWIFPYYPTVDGPAHLALIQALFHYSDPATPFYRDMFELQLDLHPNWFFHAFCLLLFNFVQPVTAEKLFISLYLIAFPLALRYAARAFGPEAGFVGLLGIPLAHHALLSYGFYNTTFAFVFFLLIVGFWLRHAEQGGWRALAVYAGLAVGGYLCHLSGLVMAVTAIAVAALSRTVQDLAALPRSLSPRDLGRRFLTRAILPAIGFLPAVGMALTFLLFNRLGDGAESQLAGIGVPSAERVLSFLGASGMIQYSAEEVVGSAFFMLGVLSLTAASVLGRDRRSDRDGVRRDIDIMVVFFGLLILYFVLPYELYVQRVPLRLQPYVLLALLLWLASRVPGRTEPMQTRMRVGAAGIALGAMVLLTSARVQTIKDLNDHISEVVALSEDIEPGSTLLALPLGRQFAGQALTDRHFTLIQLGSYIALARHAIDLKNYQLHTSVVPIVFRPEIWPWRHIASDADFINQPMVSDVTRFRQATGRPVDAVILFGDPQAFPTDMSRSRLTRALAADYELVGVSEPLGIGRLYRFQGN